jgi:hypothetical protein
MTAATPWPFAPEILILTIILGCYRCEHAAEDIATSKVVWLKQDFFSVYLVLAGIAWLR